MGDYCEWKELTILAGNHSMQKEWIEVVLYLFCKTGCLFTDYDRTHQPANSVHTPP
jgi:hypothetical protein